MTICDVIVYVVVMEIDNVLQKNRLKMKFMSVIEINKKIVCGSIWLNCAERFLHYRLRDNSHPTLSQLLRSLQIVPKFF